MKCSSLEHNFAPVVRRVMLAALLALSGCDGDDETPPDDPNPKEDSGNPNPDGGPEPDSGNRPDATTTCTTQAVYGLSIDVRREPARNCDDLRATARDGNYVETLERSVCNFYGAPERAGEYIVRIESEDRYFQTDDLLVRSGTCHVIPTSVEILFSDECTSPLDADDGGVDDSDDAGIIDRECFFPR